MRLAQFALSGALAFVTFGCDKSLPCLTEGASRKLDCECPSGMHVDYKPGSKTDSFCALDDAGTDVSPSRADEGDASHARSDASKDAPTRTDLDSAVSGEPTDSDMVVSDAKVEAADGGATTSEAEAGAVNDGVTDAGASMPNPCDLPKEACQALCVGDADCDGATSFCCTSTDGALCDVTANAGHCVPKLAQGVVCKDGRQCGSGHCTDGVCCDSADCQGSCQACNVPGKGLGTCSSYDDSDLSPTNDAPLGTCPANCMACDGRASGCVNVPPNADWKNVCATMPATSCSTTGACDGSGMCQLYGKETSCDDGLYCNGADSCDGAGNCSHAGDPCGSVTCGSCDESSNSCQNKETWYDTVNDLTWEVTPSATLLSWTDALDYCANATHCGNDHWRLPTISELRRQTRGCTSTSDIINSPCVVNDSLKFESYGAACSGCTTNAGPALGGCYRPAELEGPCGYLWSSSITLDSAGNATDNAWVILFAAAKLEWFATDTKIRVRCVRSGS